MSDYRYSKKSCAQLFRATVIRRSLFSLAVPRIARRSPVGIDDWPRLSAALAATVFSLGIKRSEKKNKNARTNKKKKSKTRINLGVIEHTQPEYAGVRVFAGANGRWVVGEGETGGLSNIGEGSFGLDVFIRQSIVPLLVL